MITQEKIRLYQHFKGDVDMWARVGSKKQRAILDDGDWSLIDSCLQDIFIVNKGLASQSFSDNLDKKLNEVCDCQETIAVLEKIALSS